MDFEMRGDVLHRYRGNQEVVHVPPGVVRIGSEAFAENDTIREVYLPDSVEGLESKAFKNCKNLRKAVLSDRLNHIGKGAFAFCDDLEEVSLGSQLRWFEADAFFDCVHLREIRFPPTLEEIGASAFFCCLSLREVNLPDGVHTINRDCFKGCFGLRRVSIPANLESIGVSAFGWCGSQLELEVAPDNPRFRGQHGNLLSKDGSTLYCCPARKGAVSIEAPITILGENCLAYSHISHLELPQGLREVKRWALWHCTDLQELKLPDGLTRIENDAFHSSGLTELVIPASVKYIGDLALSGRKLHHLTFLGSEINADYLCFESGLQPDTMLTADNMEIADYPKPFQAIHGLRSCAARWAAGEAVPIAVQRRFRKYLKRTYQKYWNDPQIFALILELKVLPASEIEAALQKAEEMKEPAITAALLQYQHEMFSQEQVDEAWQRQISGEEEAE